ncbi:MAG: DMT family transporter [Phormidesmis sp.]
MTPSTQTLALAWGCLAALTWGLTGTFIKLLPGFTTIEVLSVRIGIAFSLTLIIFAAKPALLSASVRLIRQPTGILLSSLMVFYYLFAVRAFQLAPVSDVTLMVGLSPVMALVVKAIAGKKLALAEVLGAGTAFMGLLLFVLPKIQGVSEGRSVYLTGLFFALLAACVSLGYAALFKQQSARLMKRNLALDPTLDPTLDPIVVSCTTFAIGTVVMMPMAIATSPHLFSKLNADFSTLAIALGLGVISTVVPTLCYSYAAKHLSPVLTTALNLLTPVSAAAIAFFLLKETIPLLSMFGAGLIFTGIILLTTAKPSAS